jgi:chemotaxis protein MotA
MLFLFGLFVVVGSVITGYLMHYGELRLLYQPNELLIIIGSGIGASIIGNPLDNLKETLKALKYLFKTRHKSKNDYLELMSLCFNVFKLMKIKGMLEIETHLENPTESELFNQAPSMVNDTRAMTFFRDYLRIMTMGVDNVHIIEDLIEREIEIYEEETLTPSKIMTSLGDALPALGIVAAVLGVIITMRSITEPPEVLGSLIAAALVGTFTGVLFAYGLFLPMANYLKVYATQKIMFMQCIKAALMGHINGNAPIVTVEFMRKSIPENVRPDFYETDQYINSRSKIS